MKIKENLKRFFTLSRSNEGFTLVELIVVIAILAILGGVAVPAYSGYITRANRTSDESMASEIRNALLLAHYSGELNDGVTVVVYYGEDGLDVATTDEYAAANGLPNSADAAMKAAFGDNYAASLRLKWDGWENEIGVAGNADAIENVKNSNFNPDALDSLLGQVQLVVDEASFHLSEGGVNISAEAAAILQANGIDINAGDTLDATTGMAAANAYVYLVGNELANIDLESENENDIEKNEAFMTAWSTFNFDGISGFDPATKAAAEYASIYALATYIDTQTAETSKTNFAAQMDAAGDPRTVADTVLSSIKNSTDANVKTAYNDYVNNGIGLADMGSFLTYMQGLSSSSDSLMQDTNLMDSGYFTSGYVADYVNSYMDLSEIITAGGNSGNVIAFVYSGGVVRCMPIDW